MDYQGLSAQLQLFQNLLNARNQQVSPSTQLQPPERKVSGRIVHPNGQPGSGLTVAANDRGIRGFEPLGRTTSDEKGFYSISYKSDNFSHVGKSTTTLQMEVSQGEELLFQTPVNEVTFNAPAECAIDIFLVEGDTYIENEYCRLERLIKPVVGDLEMSELQESPENPDITFLSRELQEDATKLQHFVLAHQIATEYKLPPQFFFALFAQGSLLGITQIDDLVIVKYFIDFNSEMRSLFYDTVLLAKSKIPSLLDQAFKNHVIPEISEVTLETIFKTLDQHQNDAKQYILQDSSADLSMKIASALSDGAFSNFAHNLQTHVDLMRTTVSTPGDGTKKNPRGRFTIRHQYGSAIAEARKFLKLPTTEDDSALAQLTKEEWVRILTSSPAMTSGSFASQDSVKAKADLMVRHMENRYPTAAFIANMKRDTSFLPGIRGSLLNAFSSPGFSLAATTMKTIFSSPSGNESASQESEAIREQQKIQRAAAMIQRIFKLAPTYRQTHALIDSGIGSSATIHAWGKTRFSDHFSEQGIFDKAEAERLFQRATDVHIASCLMAGEIQAVTAASRMSALSTELESTLLEAVDQDYPNMKSLFQLGDFCSCEECRTVHSPAAYVVDTLQFLKQRLVLDRTSSTGTLRRAKDALFSRRPDLGDIDLSCANTNIPIPYIDLVCELLEDAVSPEPGLKYEGDLSTGTIQKRLFDVLSDANLPFTPNAVVTELYNSSGERVVRDEKAVCKLTPENSNQNSWMIRTMKQTYGSEENVAAAPEYLNSTVYEILASSVYAFELPFDLAHEETRAYFAQFAISRADLMHALRNHSGPSDFQIAVEELGFSEAEATLIAKQDVDNQAKYWNSEVTPAAPSVTNVLVFVTKATIAYTDLQTLLTLKWLNPESSLSIKHLDDTCDLNKKEIAGLDDASLDRLHRFIRFWKRTGTSPKLLDRAIRGRKLGNDSLVESIFVIIRDMRRIGSQLNLSLDDVCTFYTTIPSSRYSELFLNSVANGTIDPAFKPANILENKDTKPAIRLSERVPYIALCLGATESAVQLIIDSLGGSSVILSLENLAAVYSLHKIAKALGIAVKDLLTIKTIVEINPLCSPTSTVAFLEAVKRIGDAGVAPSSLLYFLTNSSDDSDLQDLTIKEALNMIQTLREAYQLVIDANISKFDDFASPRENKQILMEVLSKVEGFDSLTLIKFSNLLNKTWVEDGRTLAEFLYQTLSFLGAACLKDILAALDQFLLPTSSDAEANTLIKYMTDALSTWLINQSKLQTLITHVESFFEFAPGVANEICHHGRLRQPASARKQLLSDILTDDALSSKDNPLSPRSAENHAIQIRALRLLSVMAKYLASMPLYAEHVGWLLRYCPEFHWFELDGLSYSLDSTLDSPQENEIISRVSYRAWANFQDVLAVFKLYVPIENPAFLEQPFTVMGLFELTLERTTLQDFISYLASLSGIEAQTLAALGGHFAFNFSTDLMRYREPSTYLRLETAATLLQRLGLQLKPAINLCRPKLSVDDGLVMRQALKARYADSEWLGVLKTLQDPIRQKKRRSLIAYLLAVNPDLHTAADLYDYFLIDVEMGSCMSSSRIVQAHSTIQLFVQRCLMGLEPQSAADVASDEGWSQWQWMANYRVWEANRKIFLWPENWIDPGLRVDQSELFQNFENDLSQTALSEDAVETCLEAYLYGLEDIAQLDVKACYYERAALRMHVFAHTRGGDPPVYYYRQFIQERDWTPWAMVDLDIDGPQLLAYTFNGRLCLAWPVFTQETDPSQRDDPVKIPSLAEVEAPGGVTSEPPKKRWRIQLAVSEKTGGKWNAKRISHEALYYPSPLAAGDSYVNDKLLPSIQSFNLFHKISSLEQWFSERWIPEQSIHCTAEQRFIGKFRLTGSKGYPEPVLASASISDETLPRFAEAPLQNGVFVKSRMPCGRELAIIENNFVPGPQHLLDTPEPMFKVTHPFQLDDDLFAFEKFLPYLYGDSSRSFVLIPGLHVKLPVDGGEMDTDFTFSDFQAHQDLWVALFVKWASLFEQNPGLNFSDMAADPEFQRLLETLLLWVELESMVRIRAFYHPLIMPLRRAINEDGVGGLMKRSTQLQTSKFDFDEVYTPQDIILEPHPIEDLTFANAEGYSSYNWELFFHVPFMIAMRLNQDQNFPLAQHWFHYIFNPMGDTESSTIPAPQKYWVTKPFFLTTTKEYVSSRIDRILGNVAADPNGTLATDLRFAISQWRDKPFQPHLIARTRPVAYQLSVVIKYIKNLIDWGDSLFREYTRESIAQATQLYILADKLLGPKPRNVPPAQKTPVETYNQLESRVDLFGNALVDLENSVPDLGPPSTSQTPPSPFTGLYFCLDQNEQLLGFWDLVADRLFKIRQCQNIEGISVPLALFSPPIDPGALVRAVAEGADVSTFLAGLNAPLPFYRFSGTIQRAVNLAELAAAMGNSLLRAVEKRDVEAVERLKGTQESSLAEAVKNVKVKTLEEGDGEIASLKLVRSKVQGRIDHLSSQEYMSRREQTEMDLLRGSFGFSAAIALGFTLASGLKLLPQVQIGAAGFGGSPQASATHGGDQAGSGVEMAVNALEATAESLEKGANLAGLQAEYEDRWDECVFETSQAETELEKTSQDIANAQLHITMLQADIDQQDLAVTQLKDMDKFMRSKFTNQELYDWMLSSTSKTYFSSYQLAFDVAKQAEQALQLELGTQQTFLKFGYDSLRKGLLAADGLVASIRAMETAYHDQNRRDYELKKHVSLTRLDPESLINLRATGGCMVQIPEALFDLDHPGHYMRRHKSVSLSILCKAEPYTSVSCKLSLLRNRYRAVNTFRQGVASEHLQYAEDEGRDGRFVYDVGTAQSIATSSAESDAGLFELDFNDERYLPFEYTGAIATWLIELPPTFHQFDYTTITDVILHLNYTAREGGSRLRDLVTRVQKEQLHNMALNLTRRGLYHAYILRQQFPDQWSALQSTGSATLRLKAEHLPYFVWKYKPSITGMKWFATSAPGSETLLAGEGLFVDGDKLTLEPVKKNLEGWFVGTNDKLVQLENEFVVKMPEERAKILGDLILVVKIELD